MKEVHMCRLFLVLAIAISGVQAHAAPYPIGSHAEAEMESFVPQEYMPGHFSFIRYFQELQEIEDMYLHFDDEEIMLFDLPIPAEPHIQKAPE